jgi:hypothetical protein
MVPPRDSGLSGLNEVLPSLDFLHSALPLPTMTFVFSILAAYRIWVRCCRASSTLCFALPVFYSILKLKLYLQQLKLKLYLQQLEQGGLAFSASSARPFGVRDCRY